MSRRGWLVTGAGAALLLAVGGTLAHYRSEHLRWPWEKSWIEQEEEEQRRLYGRRILKVAALKDHCYDVRYSPDGKHIGLAIGGSVEIRDSKTLELAARWSGTSTCASISFHPTKPWIACGTWAPKGVVEIRKWPEGELVKRIETDTDGVNFDGSTPGMGHDSTRSCAFSFDGRYLVATTDMGVGVAVCDTETWSIVTVLSRPGERPFTSVPYSRTPRFACDFSGQKSHVYSLSPTPREEAPPATLFDDVYGLYSMDDGEKRGAFIGRSTQEICVKGLDNAKRLLTCSPVGNFQCLELSHGGDILAVGDDYSYVCFWRVSTGERVAKVKFGAPIKRVRFSNDDREALIDLGTALVRFQM